MRGKYGILAIYERAMEESFMEVTRGNCPHCKRKLFNYNPGSWRYESPIRTCFKCKKKYVDTRYHEIVIDGIRPDALSVDAAATGVLIGTVFAAICLGVTYWSISYDGSYYPMMVLLGIMGVIMMIGCMADFLIIITGVKKRRFDALREKSDQRLQDKNYAQELLSVGYDVPEKYL